MSSITIEIPDDRLLKLKEIADHYQLTPEELLLVSLEELLARPEDEFHNAVSYVLKKNADLYQRLA